MLLNTGYISFDHKVRSCPVCNSVEIEYYEQGLARKRHGECYFIETPEYFIECNNCGFEVCGGDSIERAVKEWNTAVPSELDKRAWERQQERETKNNEL